MKISYFLFGLVIAGSLTACRENGLFQNRQEWATVQQDFEKKQELFPATKHFSLKDITQEESEALKFLYAYMPIGDIADYDEEFWLNNVRHSLQARKEMPWGKTIPEREFRHFVLPVRVNNENLDNSREIFYQEIKDRVRNLSLYEAVLEVNHWCHEKAIYSPSDSRTSSPLATVRSAYGRCGEESTLLVAALRSVGIPARQVYTPRWAHTDDNHAWVEAWVDGKWYFLGACEPEPVLNLGWFNAPASRGMLMHTKVFGKYDGPEEVMSRTPCYTEINVIENYAPAGRAEIFVKNSDGKPAEGVQVDFKIYNYAEFYTVVSKQTDKDGKTSLTAGKGDMLAWATDGKQFGFSKISFAQDTAVTIVMDKHEGEPFTLPIDIVPPKESASIVQVTEEQRAENNRRMAQEDSIRNAYTSTFLTREKANAIASELHLDSTVLTPLLTASRGNHAALTQALGSLNEKERATALQLLQTVSDKDLRDIPQEVVTSHVKETPLSDCPYFDNYILNPRIANEMLCGYKQFLREAVSSILNADSIRNNPELFTQWCKQNIRICNEQNPLSIPVTPIGVWQAKCADTHSRDIFYVAALRSLGVAARIDGVTGKTQYADATGKWQDVNFQAEISTNMPQGILTLKYNEVKSLKDPVYYTHFTLSRYENGRFRLLTFPEDNSSTWARLFAKPMPLDTGYYMLTTGTRLANGGVLGNVTFFRIEKGKTTQAELVMRENPDQIKVIGNFNSESLFLPAGSETPQSILQTTGRGYFVVAILGTGQEPTNHALRDIAPLKKEFEDWGRGMVFLFPSDEQHAAFRANEFPPLPSTITFGTDQGHAIQQQIEENLKLRQNSLPIFIIADTFNRIVFVSQGYTIGLGEQLMKTIHKLEQ